MIDIGSADVMWSCCMGFVWVRRERDFFGGLWMTSQQFSGIQKLLGFQRIFPYVLSLYSTSNRLASCHHRAHICSTRNSQFYWRQIYMLTWQPCPSSFVFRLCLVRFFIFSFQVVQSFFFFFFVIQHKFHLFVLFFKIPICQEQQDKMWGFFLSKMNVGKVCGRENDKQIRNSDKVGIEV